MVSLRWARRGSGLVCRAVVFLFVSCLHIRPCLMSGVIFICGWGRLAWHMVPRDFFNPHGFGFLHWAFCYYGLQRLDEADLVFEIKCVVVS